MTSTEIWRLPHPASPYPRKVLYPLHTANSARDTTLRSTMLSEWYPKQYHLYLHSPNDFHNTGELNISMENQRVDTHNFTTGVVEPGVGRMSIIIEGEREKVFPYYEAIRKLMGEEVKS